MLFDVAAEYAKKFIGQPYIWGGDDPIIGFDCSGLVQEILASVGMDPPGDQTAQGLYDHFKNNSDGIMGIGALCFYGKSVSEITHVAFMIENYCIVEAGGGGSKTTSAEAAADMNAFVRIRPYNRRKDLVAVLNPYYS